MSNTNQTTKAQRRKAAVSARSKVAGRVRRELLAYLTWESLSDEQRDQLARGGIYDSATYQDVCAGVMKAPGGKDLTVWVGECGLGVVDTFGDYVQTHDARIREQALKDHKARLSGAQVSSRRKDELGITTPVLNRHHVYTLPSGRAYLAAPYSMDSAEGRIWLDNARRNDGLMPYKIIGPE